MATTTITITDGMELTIDPEMLRRAGFRPGEKVRVDTSGEDLVIRRSDSSKQREDFDKIERMSSPASIHEIVNYVRELRGHDEFD
jgi:bifunctional DNA-binding transcriptional regulator/antitoxin component of YhaV-PrlF toxin-antitoxin module